MASLDKEQADLEKALATSADEHTRLLAAKQTQELMLVEHLSALNISPGSRGNSSLLRLLGLMVAQLSMIAIAAQIAFRMEAMIAFMLRAI